eukprot:4070169-Pyramimonas_sp.AAC.1
MPPEALCFDSEHSYTWKELYEVPGADQVDGSPPVPVCTQLGMWGGGWYPQESIPRHQARPP